MATPLLATKLQCPPPRPNLVHRPRLVERLETDLAQGDGFARKLTLVSAPAGYGKTTLVAEWLNARGEGSTAAMEARLLSSVEGVPAALDPRALGVAWLLLDDSDNDPRRFTTYLVAAMSRIEAGIGRTASAMLQAPQPPPSEAVLTALLNETGSTPRCIVLVLDDYHVIHTPSIHRQMEFLLDHLSANLHLVITTREDPLLPVPRLRARGQVLEIRQEDLRFTAGETSEFLERVMGLSVSIQDVATLERRTEGWIAGLQLAALSMQGRDDVSGFIRAFSGSSRFILDYLIDEVFERQTAGVKDFLLKTSILERLSARLCDAVADVRGSHELLAKLEQENLFLTPLEPSGVWYRYHRLFAELLRHRLRAFTPQLESELHQRASRWFEAEGMDDEAIRHALEAQAWDRAAHLVQRAAEGTLKRGEVQTVVGWFRSLPETMLQSDPKLCFDYCWPLLLAGQYEEAGPLLAGLEHTARESPVFLGEVAAAQAYLARGIGDSERMVERSQRAMELLPASSVSSRGIVALNLGLAYWHMGRMSEAERVLHEALEAAQATGNLYASLTALIFLGRVFAVRGKLRAAEERFGAAIQQGGDIPVNALAHMDLGALHYERDELEASEGHVQKAIALSQRSQNDEFLVGCWILAMRLRIAQGDRAGAEEALGHAANVVRSARIPGSSAERVDVARAWLRLAKGEPRGDWSRMLTPQADCHPFYRFLGVTKARILAEAGARSYLEGLREKAQANDWGYGLIAVRALQGSMAESRDAAVGHLTEALRRADGEGFIRSFVEVGERLIPVLRETARRGMYPEHVRMILAAMTRGAGGAEARSASTVEALSERELEVLRLVAAGKSNREIAEKLVVSLGTAKTHVHNLCGKLGVRNRTEAAMKAKDLGLA
jgi:LuxR family maltose regulon positive regulatory protein